MPFEAFLSRFGLACLSIPVIAQPLMQDIYDAEKDLIHCYLAGFVLMAPAIN